MKNYIYRENKLATSLKIPSVAERNADIVRSENRNIIKIREKKTMMENQKEIGKKIVGSTELQDGEKLLGLESNKPKEEEMYCIEVDNETGKVCGEIDETFSAYCIKHGRSYHAIRDKLAFPVFHQILGFI